MNLRIKSNNYWTKEIFFIGVFSILILISIFYILLVKLNLNLNRKKYIRSISEAQLSIVENKLETSIKSLYLLSDFIDIYSQETNKDKKNKLLKDILIDTKFYDIGFINFNGNIVTANNSDIKSKRFFNEIINGKKYDFEYAFDEEINEYIFYIAVPVYEGEKFTGVLFAKEIVSEIEGYESYEEDVSELDRYIIHSDGTIIYRDDFSSFETGENLFDELKNYNKVNEVLDIQDKIKDKQSTTNLLNYMDKTQILSIYPVKLTEDFYSIISIDSKSIENSVIGIEKVSFILIILFLFLIGFSLFILLIYREKNKELKEENYRKKRFLSNISHEIRTPMNGVIGSVELALKNKDNQQKLQYYLNNTLIASNNLLNLFDDLLTMTKGKLGELRLYEECVSVREIIQKVNSIVLPILEQKKKRYTIDISSLEDISVICDENKIVQILINLIINSSKFTEENGEIHLSIQLKKVKSNNIGQFVFSVEDNGIGMTKEFMHKMFLPFTQADEFNSKHNGGAGLGLSITKSIVDLMGGEIEVESELAHGTRFDITLPLKIVDSNFINAGCYKNFSNIGQGKRVLLAEDDEISRIIECELLNSLGFEVDAAINGKEAYKKFIDSDKDYYDLILIDHIMPEMNGYECCNKICNSNHWNAESIIILAMTAGSLNKSEKLISKSGVNDSLTKPINKNLFIEKLEKVF
ncbi:MULTISPECIES: ATP-binding protein [Clostridium]|uniref:hybrid sensor histidine kinase/response regulator n=1 Tax=Clostridium TaxID=1485 RepID=UPI00189B1B73|nr:MULTISPECIES: ATP-binding protein [Clostridium]MDB2123184.1 ATP-binding protein [Clostridium paraputrificum]MDU1586551.1 ATP-binding protein [Clostridium sp.]MDU1977684.1 ATP-binding protein [Clostridium sp.]MDU1993837.1 ATP-binding protein [Clostridium sp.]MDU6047716.1 ATP-binding protein [Clostridium sp.]